MNPMVPGLGGGKMSSSDPNSKIDFLDPPEVVRRKIKNAFCEEGNTTQNGVLSFVQAVLIPISELRIERSAGKTGADAEEGEGAVGAQTPFVIAGAPAGTVFSISRKDEHGGPLHYTDFKGLEKDFAEKKVHPKDLKTAVADAIVRLLDPIRATFETDEEWQKVEKLAYPDPNAKPEKKKKVRQAVFLVYVHGDECVCVLGQSVPPTSSGQGQEREACRGGREPGSRRWIRHGFTPRRGSTFRCRSGEAGGFVMDR